MSKAQSTQGTKLYVESTTAGTYIAIGEITTVGNITDDTSDDIDVTNLDSEGYKEYIGGLKDPPSVDFAANYIADDAGQLRLKELYESGEPISFKLEVGKPLTSSGDPLTILRDGYVSKYSFDVQINSKVGINFTVKFSGAPAVTEAD
jgi:predicted secreted protein